MQLYLKVSKVLNTRHYGRKYSRANRCEILNLTNNRGEVKTKGVPIAPTSLEK